MSGVCIALLSGALMSIQGVFNTEVTKQTSLWVSSAFVQFTALLVCLTAWLFTDRTSFLLLGNMKQPYMLLAGVIGSSIDEPEGWSLAETVGFSAFALVFAVFGVFLIFHVRRRLVVEGGVFSYLPTFGRSRAFRLADIAGMTIGTNGRRLVGQDGRTLARFEDNQENSAILLQYLSEHGVGLLVK